MKKFVAVILMMVMMVSVSAQAAMTTEECEAAFQRITEESVLTQEGSYSAYISFHDEGEHCIELYRKDCSDVNSPVWLTAYRGGWDGEEYLHRTVTEDQWCWIYVGTIIGIYNGLL